MIKLAYPSIALLAVALVLPCAPALASAKKIPATETPAVNGTAQIKLEGFRSAHWGMTEDQVRAAIVADFKIDAAAIKQTTDVAQGTGILATAVTDLLPDSGKAIVTYIFGASSQKLIEVNVGWDPAVDATITQDKLVQTATALARYFSEAGYVASSVKTNMVTPDGSVVVFNGADKEGHSTTLLLRRSVSKDASGKTVVKTNSLLLAYSADPAKPDVHRIAPGQF